MQLDEQARPDKPKAQIEKNSNILSLRKTHRKPSQASLCSRDRDRTRQRNRDRNKHSDSDRDANQQGKARNEHKRRSTDRQAASQVMTSPLQTPMWCWRATEPKNSKKDGSSKGGESHNTFDLRPWHTQTQRYKPYDEPRERQHTRETPQTPTWVCESRLWASRAGTHLSPTQAATKTARERTVARRHGNT